jgi:hypothetical protein
MASTAPSPSPRLGPSGVSAEAIHRPPIFPQSLVDPEGRASESELNHPLRGTMQLRLVKGPQSSAVALLTIGAYLKAAGRGYLIGLDDDGHLVEALGERGVLAPPREPASSTRTQWPAAEDPRSAEPHHSRSRGAPRAVVSTVCFAWPRVPCSRLRVNRTSWPFPSR